MNAPALLSCAAAALLLLTTPDRASSQPIQAEEFTEVRSFPAEEARQAVAVDDTFFYAIDNRAVGKYDRRTGAKVAAWSGPAGGPIHHLNSGLVRRGRLYAAHSNFPDLPMVSSIEVFDAATLEHVGSHSFGIYEGSGTWVDFHDGSWWVVFAHYAGDGGAPGKGPAWTTLVRFDEEWVRRAAWTFPDAVIERFHPYSCSGGAWGPDGLLYVTGHDRPEVYRLRLPRAGSTLELVDVVPAPIQGQGIAWDPASPGTLFGIRRADRRVVVAAPGGE